MLIRKYNLNHEFNESHEWGTESFEKRSLRRKMDPTIANMRVRVSVILIKGSNRSFLDLILFVKFVPFVVKNNLAAIKDLYQELSLTTIDLGQAPVVRD